MLLILFPLPLFQPSIGLVSTKGVIRAQRLAIVAMNTCLVAGRRQMA